MKHQFTYSRRALLKMGAASAASLLLTPIATWAVGDRAQLRIPPQDSGNTVNGTRQFDLNIGDGETEFLAGIITKTKGINGDYLGPTLRFRAGETVRLTVNNALNEETTLHWHGFNLPAKSDGGPHQIVSPGEDWIAEFEVREKAATMWYHSHQFHKTAEQVWDGLAGMIIVDDEAGDALNLPASYGVDDIPAVLQDRSFDRRGRMTYGPGMRGRMVGMTGDTALVNGTIAPYFDVTTSLVRLRLLNGANASIYDLGFADGRQFSQIGSDGGLLAAPVSTNRVRLAPGERADIVVDMSDGAPAMLRSIASRTGGMGAMMGGGGAFEFLELRPAPALRPSPVLPRTLADLPVPDVSNVTGRRSLDLQMRGMMMGMFTGGGFGINGKAMNIDRIDQVVKRGETKIWQITNSSMMAHPLHIHNTQFRILDRNGTPPPAGEAGLKDTVLVDPGEVVNLLIRFDHYTDPDRPYMYHCHILEHEDGGMMGQFTVV